MLANRCVSLRRTFATLKMDKHKSPAKNSGKRHSANRNHRPRHGQKSRGLSTNSQNWPSINHRCVLLYHNDRVLPISDLKEMIKPYGTIMKSRGTCFPNYTMSAVEMSTSTEAENVWKGMMEKKPNGVVNVKPDKEHKTIESFAKYWSDEEIEEGLKNGTLLSGSLRMNPRMYQHAFISDSNRADILIDSLIARNRALAGDVVVVKVRDPSQWILRGEMATETDDINSDASQTSANGNKVKTCDVVGILEKVHSRLCAGIIAEPRRENTLFRPIDNCMPRILVPSRQCPPEFFKRTGDFSDKMFLASINEWSEDAMLPNGMLQEFLGDKTEIEAETARILAENGVDDTEFPPTVQESMPSDSWTIPPEEYRTRRDMRLECIFTIDPSTAKDLDDALHCKRIGENLYEVGVHIADVSFFVRPSTEVDNIASKRCTSVYLVQRVIPMLPPVLCERLCSLNPGQEKLAYSVIWTITGEGQIMDEWFGRSIIKSCTKLSYDHAQSVIEAPEKEISPDEFPDVFDGHKHETIRTKILDLHKISQTLRKGRFDNGALKLDQIKLSYTLDEASGMPNSCFTYQYKASNELVEEFMLLANISVARKLRKSVPDKAFLRCHPEPKLSMLHETASYCAKHGWKLDVTSSKSFAESLQAASNSNALPENAFFGLQIMAIKPQELALYFCTGCVDDEEKYRHYALNVPLYTHFTSPIRRYADVIVHRQLSIALGDDRSEPVCAALPDDLQRQASACNNRKSTAKKVQEFSVQLFFYSLVRLLDKLEDKAVVTHVYDQSFDIISLKYGQTSRVYINSLPLVGSKHNKHLSTLELLWPCDGTDRYKLTEKEKKLAKDGNLKMPKYSETVSQTISVFHTVDVIFEAMENELKIRTYLKRKNA